VLVVPSSVHSTVVPIGQVIVEHCVPMLHCTSQAHELPQLIAPHALVSVQRMLHAPLPQVMGPQELRSLHVISHDAAIVQSTEAQEFILPHWIWHL